LDAALDQERPGILRWVLDGAKEWYTRTLDPPECVRLATDEYLDGEDTTALFVRERLTIDPSARAALTGAVGAILPAYRAWCDTMGFHPMGRIRFQKQMERLIPQAPFTNWKEGGGVVHGWIGIKLTDGVLD
jgi:putative DNA primase/helicase